MQIAKLSFDCSEPIPPTSVRGYIGWLVDDIALHNHLSKDAYIFGYPCVQYKKIADNYKIIGFNEGIDAVRAVALLLDTIVYKVNGAARKTVEVKDRRLRIYEAHFGLADREYIYKLNQPWMALNSKNYHIYTNKETEAEKIDMLKSILVNNIISMCKRVNYTVDGEIEPDIKWLRPQYIEEKNVNMLAFTGEIEVNFLIPDFLGIGKLSSRGYGVLKRKRQENIS